MKRNKKKRKIRFDRIFLFLFCTIIVCLIGYGIFNIPITNIYVTGTDYLKEQEIIEKANLSDYPATFQNLSFMIKDKLKGDTYIKDVKVSKKGFTKVYIEITENKPLFYYQTSNETILLDGTSVDDKYNVPTVLNYITDTHYNDFVKKMGLLDKDILTRISEIQFVPNDVDDNRFLLSMNDGNYIYINILTFEKLNRYLTIMENLPKENGILYLDYGNNFEILK